MDYFFRLEQWWLLGVTIPLLIVGMLVRYRYNRATHFKYSLAQTLYEHKQTTRHPFQIIFYIIRLIVLGLLALVACKPQIVDSRSNIIIDGIDIMLVLDASGSMQFNDYGNEDTSRFQVAKEEAIRFIEKRSNDAIGLVLFAKDALSRCPLTMDKKIVTDMVNALELGVIDPDGTMLATGMITAINRLRHSKAKSKIMILLTDGEPSPADIDPSAVIEIAKKLDIKVYTIRIGSDKAEVFMHQLYGLVQKPKVNADLLKQIARTTGGRFFMARNARDMRTVYDTIDRLEKTKHEAPLYSRYFDIFASLLGMAALLLLVQQLLATFIWFSI